jgi:hypothetical protein
MNFFALQLLFFALAFLVTASHYYALAVPRPAVLSNAIATRRAASP